jgi:predicted acyltransferase
MMFSMTQPPVSAVSVAHAAPKPPRILSVDILRGITIAFMILVNTAGDSKVTYAQLEHARWNGFTMTDLVFPTFLFLVGCSIVFSLQSRLDRGDSRAAMIKRIFTRGLAIFALDLFISAIPHFHYTRLRLYGVLTRIAIVYVVVSLIFIATRRIRTLLGITAVCLIVYWILMRYVPTPGLGHPVYDFPILDPDKNLGAWMDRGIMGFIHRTINTGHLYEKTRDPEGMLSTIPSFGTALLGCCAALWMRRPGLSLVKNRLVLLGFGVLSIIGGVLWNPYLPINKKVWTSSYVLLCAGIAMICLSLLSMVLDRPDWAERPAFAKALIWPWQVLGSNAIFAYAVSEILPGLFGLFHFANPDNPSRPLGLWTWGYLHTVARNGSTANTSLIYSLCFVALCFFFTWLLWRRQIFLKL